MLELLVVFSDKACWEAFVPPIDSSISEIRKVSGKVLIFHEFVLVPVEEIRCFVVRQDLAKPRQFSGRIRSVRFDRFRDLMECVAPLVKIFVPMPELQEKGLNLLFFRIRKSLFRSLESIEAANVTLRRIVRVAKWICVALFYNVMQYDLSIRVCMSNKWVCGLIMQCCTFGFALSRVYIIYSKHHLAEARC